MAKAEIGRLRREAEKTAPPEDNRLWIVYENADTGARHYGEEGPPPADFRGKEIVYDDEFEGL